MNKLPVVAAIPNYNMGAQLKSLLPVLINSGYDDIYVLDDASTDESREVVHELNPSIHFVAGAENRGAGANRNRIIDALGYNAIIHFMDADTRPETERMAEVVADAIPSEEYGFIGGLAKTPHGLQTVWNYGPRQSLWADIGAQVQSRIETLLPQDPDKAMRMRKRFSALLEDWPNPLEEPVRRQIFWAIEQNLVVDSETFARIGGFDESLREHEIQDLAIRMAKVGLEGHFDPSFALVHHKVQVRGYDRRSEMRKAEFKIAQKHGLHNWLLPDGHLKPRL